MTGLDVFALIVLTVLVASVVGGALLLAMMPGRIARKRGHPNADAINVCGWWGLLTMGILMPLAWIWAFTWPPGGMPADDLAGADSNGEVES